MKLSEELKHCIEDDACGTCQYYSSENHTTCRGLLQKAYEQIEKYENVFLCNVGDTVYCPDGKIQYIFPVLISQIIISNLGDEKYCAQYNGCFFNSDGDPEQEFEFDMEDFGKTVFLSHREAEAALKDMKEQNEV